MTALREALARNTAAQRAYAAYALAAHACLQARGDPFGAHAATLRYERHARGVRDWKVSPRIARLNARLLSELKSRTGANVLLDAYAGSAQAAGYRREFQRYGLEHEIRLRYPAAADRPSRQGDLLVLKPPRANGEKGVLLIQYNDAFLKAASLYDLYAVAGAYRIVLEPSTWGYCDPAILMYVGCGTDVVVQAQYAPDYAFVAATSSNLVPLRLGAGDWIDGDRFRPGAPADKRYDVVMVASWQRMKRHRLLFEAVAKCGASVRSVALVGYPAGGRSAADVIAEARRFGIADRLHVFDSVSRDEVGRILAGSRVGVMLSVREGANKGIYECFFCDLPVIVAAGNVGVNRDHVNEHTGELADDRTLHETIAHVLANVARYRPREWALAHTGYRNAGAALNACVQRCAAAGAEPWTADLFAKRNDTNAQYVREADRLEADRAVGRLSPLLRRMRSGVAAPVGALQALRAE